MRSSHKIKKYITVAAISASVVAPHSAISQTEHQLREVLVTTRRPMKDIGVQKTVVDSAALKENIALSMADVLTFNSPVFVKSYGRATLSTVAFRGTSPSHTQVTWNGMKINNPMMGMTDFSTIPAYFIDRSTLLHGTSSVNESGGGLGGLVRLATAPDTPDGFHLQYVQGIGSFSTFDEFLRLTWHDSHWTTSTRVVFASSPNDYTYINHDKKLNIYDDNHQIIGQYHPKEKNRNGAYNDFHALQEVYYNTLKGDKFGLNAWYMGSNRELPLLTTDYRDDTKFDNRQREETFRGILSWLHRGNSWSTDVKAGYVHTWMAYDYKRDVGGGGGMTTLTRSRSLINTFYAQAEGNYFTPDRHWLFSANLSAHHNAVKSTDRKVANANGGDARLGYDKRRLELSGTLTAKWQPTDRMGFSLVIREDSYGSKFTPVIPAFFADGVIVPSLNLMVKTSVSRNYKFPNLNELYLQPGGNPDLKSEEGVTYDCGFSLDPVRCDNFSISCGATWFDSYIDNWILWLPTTRGFFSPRNVKKVHSYGIEAMASMSWQLPKGWNIDLNSMYSWTPSLNHGDAMSANDQSIGKQLPYVPRHSANVTGRLSWSTFSFLYKWAYYSERYTMSSNETSLTGKLPEYYMSNVTLGYSQPIKNITLDFKLAINNLFDEDYLSVLSHPMPGINFELFVGLRF